MNGRDHDYLTRIAGMLVALAVLADRAERACPAVRCIVLWLLGRAESAAHAYAVEIAYASQVADPTVLLVLHRTSDASPLAERLRALASLFRLLAHWAGMASFGAPPGLFSMVRRPAIVAFRALAASTPRPLDTS